MEELKIYRIIGSDPKRSAMKGVVLTSFHPLLRPEIQPREGVRIFQAAVPACNYVAQVEVSPHCHVTTMRAIERQPASNLLADPFNKERILAVPVISSHPEAGPVPIDSVTVINRLSHRPTPLRTHLPIQLAFHKGRFPLDVEDLPHQLLLDFSADFGKLGSSES